MDMNKPVAWVDEDVLLMAKPNDFCFMASFNKPSDDGRTTWIPLYTHPVKELNDGGEPVKNATYWKRQYNLMATQNDNLKSGLYHANEQIKYLEDHPAELTDEEIMEAHDSFGDGYVSYIDFAKAILRKAQEK